MDFMKKLISVVSARPAKDDDDAEEREEDENVALARDDTMVDDAAAAADDDDGNDNDDDDDKDKDAEAPQPQEDTATATATTEATTAAAAAAEPAEPEADRKRRWGAEQEAPVKLRRLEARLGEWYMSKEALAALMRKRADEAQAKEDAAEAAVAQEKSVAATAEEEWAAELEDEPHSTPTPILCVQGMTLPFSRVLLKKYLEKPAAHVTQLNDETYRVVGDTVFVTYESVEVARKQKRRISGKSWGGSGALKATYVTLDSLEAKIEEKRQHDESQEARLRKMVEDEIEQGKQVARSPQAVLSDRFSKTTTTPRLYYRFETDKAVLASARAVVKEQIKKLLAA